MKATEQSSANNWIIFNEPSEQFKAIFPYQPVHMQFDLCEEDTLTGSLHVYSTSLNEEVLMVTTISSPSLFEIKKQDLTEDFFKRIFYSCFIRRLFYQPKLFKNSATFTIEKINLQGYPALHFTASYQDKQEKRILAGLAVIKDGKLYTILYITPETNAKNEELQQFIQSLQL